MKKTIFILIVVLSIVTLKAQVVYEKTFNVEQGYFDYFPSENGMKFYYSERNTTNLTIYNSDYSVYKSFSYPVPLDSDESYVDLVSDKLFNNDALLEFIVCSGTSSSFYDRVRLYNENNVLLHDFGEEIDWFSLWQCNGITKFYLIRYVEVLGVPVRTVEIYSLPGSYPQSVSFPETSVNHFPFPNPSQSTITLEYNLQPDETSVMHIYNANGILLEQKPINSHVDKILLNVGNYKPGVYFYEVNGVSQKFIVTK